MEDRTRRPVEAGAEAEETEEWLRGLEAAVHSLTVAAALVTEHGQHLVVNSAYAALLGREDADLAEVPLSEVTPLTAPDLRRLAAGKSDPSATVLRVLDGSGNSHWVEPRVARIGRRTERKVALYLVQLHDVSDVHAATSMAGAVRRRLQLLVQESRDLLLLAYRQEPQQVVEASGGLLARFGMGPDELPLSRERLMSLVHQDDRWLLRQLLDDPVGFVGPITVRTDVELPRRWLRIRHAPMRDGDGEVVGVEAVVFDVTDEQESIRTRQRSGGRYRRILQQSPALQGIIDQQGLVTYVNAAVTDLLGRGVEDAVGRPALDIVHPDDRSAAIAAAAAWRLRSTPAAHVELRLQHADGSWRWVDACGVDLSDDSDVNGLVVSAHDVTEQHTREEELRHHAQRDGLTELINRTTFMRLLTQQLRELERGSTMLSVLYVDLDGFKQVNDRLGHDAGDRLLRAVAQRLTRAVRYADVPARLGGDEFAVLCQDITELSQTLEIAERIVELLSRPFDLGDGETLTISASVGVALSAVEQTAESVVREADLAMYGAKRREGGGGCVKVSERAQEVVSRYRHSVLLRSAVHAGTLRVRYDAISSLTDGSPMAMRAVPYRQVASNRVDDLSVERSEALGGSVVERLCLEDAVRRVSAQRLDGASVPVPLVAPLAAVSVLGDDRRPPLHRRLPAEPDDLTGLWLEFEESPILGRPEAVEPLVRLRERGIEVAVRDYRGTDLGIDGLCGLPVRVVSLHPEVAAKLGSDRRTNAFVRQLAALMASREGVLLMGGQVQVDDVGLLRSYGVQGASWGRHGTVPAPQEPQVLPELA